MADVYDRLGLVVVASLVWFLAGLLAPFLVFQKLAAGVGVQPAAVAAVAWIILISAPLLAGIFYLARNIVTRADPGLSDIITGAREFLFRSWKLSFTQLLITVILVIDVVFFYGLFVRRGNLLFAPLAAIAFYVLIYWLTMLLYQWPLLIEQRLPTLKIIYRSFLIAADNLAFTSIAFFAIIMLTILCLFPLGMALLYMGVAAIIATSALREILKKYDLVEIEPDVPEDPGWHISDYK
jgi:hypothetical protein